MTASWSDGLLMIGSLAGGYPSAPEREEAPMTEQDPQVPETVEGEPVVEVQEATDPLTPEEVREAQQEDSDS